MSPKPAPVNKAGIGAGLVLVSASFLAFLGLWEGDNQFTVYADKLANGLPTVCRGLTRHVTSTPIVVGEVWPAAKCEAEESRAVEMVQRQVLACFTVNPPQSVFNSTSSHAWNLGANRTCGSQAMKAFNAGEWAIGCRRLAYADSGRRVWSFAGGRPVRGLERRRDAEMAECLKDVPGARGA